MSFNIVTCSDNRGKRTAPRHIGQWTSAPGVSFLTQPNLDCMASISTTAGGGMVDDLGEGNGGPMMGWSDYFDENTISFALEGDVNEAGDDDKLEDLFTDGDLDCILDNDKTSDAWSVQGSVVSLEVGVPSSAASLLPSMPLKSFSLEEGVVTPEHPDCTEEAGGDDMGAFGDEILMGLMDME
ncbi:hypothetical protein TrCOL_g8242 [Triparma columacea]|uniref:Uncharacterized protein n=1 Tax=Triparma columacea TaxID=722753 RepID=A0A9W7G503_9STRA|nr:hypothetical protein TrCOL_g8242 [Triparma columacea]